MAAILEPRPAPPADEDALIAAALAEPLGTPQFHQLARSARRVLLLVDDVTRGTPTRRILPHVARELARAGIDDDQVTILTAQGTHRRMVAEELSRKIGAEFLARWRVVQHDYEDTASLHTCGVTREGLPVVVNRLVARSDVCIGIGQVGVHAILGFSGGAKIVLPGVAGAATERGTHWAATAYPQEALMGVLENPLRLAIEEGARMAGLDAVLNVALDAWGRVAFAAFGDHVDAQRACARVAREMAAAPRIDRPQQLVVTDSAPADIDYWQSAKGLYAATICVEEGGVIVMASPSPEGVASRHPELLALGRLSTSEIEQRVEAGRVRDVIAAAVAHYTARIRERSDVILVSSGIPPEQARSLGFTPAPSMAAAVEEALARLDSDARAIVLRRGGAVLPVVRGRNEHHVWPASDPARSGRGALV